MNKRSNLIILIAVSVLSIIMIVASTVKSEWMIPVRNAAGIALAPLEKGINNLGTALYKNLTQTRQIDALIQENEELKGTIDDLKMENSRLQQDGSELERLRELYKLDQEYGRYEKIGARVIAKDSAGWFSIFRIDKGSADGICEDMNVIADGGLVGIVTEVGTNYATVRSIIDDSSRVSATTMESDESCIVRGSLEVFDSGRLILEDIPQSSGIMEGDRILTSNISSKFLPGILIGYASEITIDGNTLTKSGYVIPAAGFQALNEVLVITQLKETGES